MKTLLISADGEVPEALRTIVERGSTALVEYLVDELSGSPQPDADRVVFWSSGDETAVGGLAEAYVRDAAAEDRDSIMFVLAEGAAPGAHPPLAPEQLFTWPRDEDRLKLAFLTGA